MKYLRLPVIFGLSILIISASYGCMSLEGTKVLTAIQETTIKVGETISPSVVYVEVMPSGNTNPTRLTGLIISPEGNVLIPAYLKKDTIQKVSVWIDKEEYQANFVQSDDRRGLSIIKIKLPADIKIKSASLEKIATTKPGDWLIGINSSGKEMDYQKLLEVGLVRGKQEGELDQILISGLSLGNGTVVANLKEEIVGFAVRNQLISIYDIKRGVNKLLAKTKAPKPTIEEEKKQPWLGITFEPINEDYAAAMNLPKEGVIIRWVIKGSPADKVGLKPDDLIIALDDQPFTKSGAQLNGQLFKYLDPELNREVNFKVLRNGETKNIKCQYASRPDPKEFKAEDIGISVQEITDLEYRERRLSIKEGVMVNNVSPGSPAATGESASEFLIYPGDVIIEIAGVPIKNLDEFINAIDTTRRDKTEVVLVKIWRGNHITHQALNLKIGKK